MRTQYLTLLLGALGLGALLALGDGARSQEQPFAAPDGQPEAAQEGGEVQAHGPVHEAFAAPVGGQPQPTPIVPKQPPDPIEEAPPDQRPEGDNVQWIPGYWAWDDDTADFLWVSGFWRNVPPGRQWMPGHWAQVEGGTQWTPGFWAEPEQTQVNYLPPPPPTIDAGPSTPAPGTDSVYVAGTWVYRETRYVWRPGFWCGFRPGWLWQPAHYVYTPSGYLFVEGFWDYPLQSRGLLFAPVVIRRELWARPGFVFRPSFVVYDTALVGALFVRPNYCSYYFGDYFDPGYQRRGFVPWVDFRVGRRGVDPLFSYYRWHHRNDRVWERDLRTLYVQRRTGEVPRPPRTFVQQTQVINNITNKTVNVTNVNNTINNVTVLAPLIRVDKTKVKLQKVAPAQLAQERKAAQQLVAVSKERRKVEAQVLAKGPAPTRPNEPARVVKAELPKLRPAVKAAAAAKAPPPPPLPKHVEAPVPKHEPVQPTRLQPHPAAKPEAKPEPRPGAKPEPKPAAKPEAKPEPKPQPKPAPKPEAKPPAKPEPKAAPKPEGKPEPKPQPKAAPKPEVKPPAKPEPKPEPKPAPKPEVKPQPKPEVKPPAQPPAKPAAPAPAPKPEVKPAAPAPQPRPEVKPPAKPAAPAPAPKPEVKPPAKPQKDKPTDK